jgi:hypothetical protein
MPTVKPSCPTPVLRASSSRRRNISAQSTAGCSADVREGEDEAGEGEVADEEVLMTMGSRLLLRQSGRVDDGTRLPTLRQGLLPYPNSRSLLLLTIMTVSQLRSWGLKDGSGGVLGIVVVSAADASVADFDDIGSGGAAERGDANGFLKLNEAIAGDVDTSRSLLLLLTITTVSQLRLRGLKDGSGGVQGTIDNDDVNVEFSGYYLPLPRKDMPEILTYDSA